MSDTYALPMRDPLAWFETAACKSSPQRDVTTVREDVDRMFTFSTTIGGSRHERNTRIEQARAVCATCPHAGFDGPCVAEWWSLDDDGQRAHGMWGGYTGDELLAAKDAGRAPHTQRDRLRFASTRDRVWHAIDEGANTVPMLVDALGLTRRQVGSALSGLSEAGRIRHVVAGGGRDRVAVWEVMK